MKNKKIQPNDVFGQLKVIKYLGNSDWECQCSCGNITVAKTGKLTTGRKTRCEECTKSNDSRLIDLTNQVIGDWKVLEYAGNRYWKCQCLLCSGIYDVRGSSLRSKTSTCCIKCNNKKQSIPNIDLSNKTFGALKVKRYLGKSIWECECSCGKIVNVRSDYLLSNKIKSCGNRNLHDPRLNLTNRQFGDWKTIKKEIYNYIKSMIPNELVIQSDRTILNGLELDIYIPSRKIAIEFNGSYWHSDIFKTPKYHQNKTISCGKKGIRLIHIFEYEWNNLDTRNKLKLFLADILNSNKNKVYARNCEVKQISYDESSNFLNKYHLQGNTTSSIQYGIYNKNELLGVMTFGKPRFNTNYEYELIRSCWKPGNIVIGGKEKIFKAFLVKYNPISIISYCDESKFIGNSYIDLGFKVDGNKLTFPSYVWVNSNTNEILSRYQSQKHNLVKNGLAQPSQSEREALNLLGYLRIYDCGCARFVWKR